MQIVSHVSKREFVFAFLSEVTRAAVIGEVFSFMVVHPRLRFQVLAIYIYYCGIFNIPSFLSEKKNLLPFTSRGCIKIHFALFALKTFWQFLT